MTAAQACHIVVGYRFYTDIERVHVVLTTYAKGEPVQSGGDISSGMPPDALVTQQVTPLETDEPLNGDTEERESGERRPEPPHASYTSADRPYEHGKRRGESDRSEDQGCSR